jgi:threonine aldolase
MTARLADDHANAQLLAKGVAEIPGVKIDPEKAQTNIIIFDIGDTGMNTTELAARLKAREVLANGISPREMRMVTHRDVSRADCETALSAIRDAMAM